jgi:Animal haem peroxidase
MSVDLRLSHHACVLLLTVLGMGAPLSPARAGDDDARIIADCLKLIKNGARPIAETRTERFQGKVGIPAADCRGGEKALGQRGVPWVDWSNYWGAADARSRTAVTDDIVVPPLLRHLVNRNTRGVDGALTDIEYQRMELIKFNLFDNSTYEQYVKGSKVNGRQEDGSLLKRWKEMRLAAGSPNIGDVQTDAKTGEQTCKPEAIRFRTLNGICNDIVNPAMGSAGMPFARNVQFESTYPDLGQDPLAKNRHGGRISLLKPDPAVISRKLFTRDQTGMPNCNLGKGTGAPESDCAYRKAPFFNVIAAFWIQFMTHDWFTHMQEARNDTRVALPSLGCTSERVNNVEQPISPERAAALGCRPADKMEAALIADNAPAPTFGVGGKSYFKRSPKTSRNLNTAWWDASQIYGYDNNSRRRMHRDPADRAKLQMEPAHSGTAGDDFGYLPVFGAPCAAAGSNCDPIQPEWEGQEAAAFADNWSIGLSFLHNVFVREHNIFVDEFRKAAKAAPNEDSGLRDPAHANDVIRYKDISDDVLFELARLVVAAEIAKIHTTEWTPQLLYDEPLYIGMNANWSGVFKDDAQASKASKLANEATVRIVAKLSKAKDPKLANQFYSALAAGPGIVGTGSDGSYPEGANDGVNHFGSPFNFPEEFVSVYRLHPLVPDMIELRELSDPNAIARRVPVIETFRRKATEAMRKEGLSNWALSMGRQRLGLLLLRNHPQFLQNLDIRPRFDVTLDVPALDIIRDREHGVPRFNEFRRQIGLRQLTSFDDFIDKRLDPNDANGKQEIAYQQDLVNRLREIYGTHVCDASKVITAAQLDRDGKPINDCLGHQNGSTVDNIEDVDIVPGFLAETTRPHGYAISETQFHIFIINASRRLYSDRFFTSSFRPEFYSSFGLNWVMNNGPGEPVMEEGLPNGHEQQVLPMKRVLLRTMPELKDELKTVVNAFDPWARDRTVEGNYYSVKWSPRTGAEDDPAFK